MKEEIRLLGLALKESHRDTGESQEVNRCLKPSRDGDRFRREFLVLDQACLSWVRLVSRKQIDQAEDDFKDDYGPKVRSDRRGT